MGEAVVLEEAVDPVGLAVGAVGLHLGDYLVGPHRGEAVHFTGLVVPADIVLGVEELGKTEEEILLQGMRALYADVMLGQGSAMTRLSENDYHECLKRARENSKNPEAILRQEETQKRAVLWDSL